MHCFCKILLSLRGLKARYSSNNIKYSNKNIFKQVGKKIKLEISELMAIKIFVLIIY